MPFYRVPGLGMVHMKIGGRKKAPAPCSAVIGLASQAAEVDHCLVCSSFLCDWPVAPGKTCDAALCERHAHQVGPNRHYCPDHHLAHLRSTPQRTLFDGNLEPQ